MSFRKICFAIVLFLAATEAVSAASLDKLTGAWTMAGTDCKELFVRDGARWRFKNRDSSLNTGLIIEGRSLKGSYGTCTIGRIVEKNDTFVAVLACESAVMFNEFTVHFRVVDDTHFARFDPEMPEFYVTYQKCAP